jgi:nitroreductase
MAIAFEQIDAALNWRYATKQFNPEARLDETEVTSILNAARLSASSFGLQPWRFVVVRDPGVRATLKASAYNQPQLTDASHLIVLCRHRTLTPKHVEAHVAWAEKVRGVPAGSMTTQKDNMLGFLNRMGETALPAWMEKQVYLALGTLLSVAALRAIDACPMEGFQPDKFDEILGLPERGLRAVVLCTLGRRADTDPAASAKKVRFPIDEVLK